MPLPQITKITVTHEDGSEQTFEGAGYLQVTSAQEKNPNGGMAKVVGTSVSANLVVLED